MIAYGVFRPTSPSCLEPALPTQTTLQRSGLGISSSRISSTTWPRLRSKLPRNWKPSFEESRTRQGSLFGLRSRLMTRLARLFDTTRFERRGLRTGKLGILHIWSRSSDGTPGLGSFEMRNDKPLGSCAVPLVWSGHNKLDSLRQRNRVWRLANRTDQALLSLWFSAEGSVKATNQAPARRKIGARPNIAQGARTHKDWNWRCSTLSPGVGKTRSQSADHTTFANARGPPQ